MRTNYLDRDHKTFLKFIEDGNIRGIKRLIDRGFDVNIHTDKNGGYRCPFIKAIDCMQLPILKILVENGVSPDADGYYTGDYYKNSGISYGPIYAAVINVYGPTCPLNGVSRGGYNLKKRIEVLKYLLTLNIDIKERGIHDLYRPYMDPLVAACAAVRGLVGEEETIQYNIIDMLLKHEETNVHYVLRDRYRDIYKGDTICHWAARNRDGRDRGKQKLLQHLGHAGADLNMKNGDRHTVLDTLDNYNAPVPVPSTTRPSFHNENEAIKKAEQRVIQAKQKVQAAKNELGQAQRALVLLKERT